MVRGKTVTFVISPFCTPYSICLTMAFDWAVSNGNVAFSIIVLSIKKLYSSFSKRVLVFLKTYLKVKVLKTFKISSVCHQKHTDILNGGLF